MSHYHPALHAHLAKKKLLTFFDKVIFVAAFLYPLSGLPQAYEVFQGNVAGVSVAAWLGFVVFSILFLIYGIIHDIKPMVITSGLWLIVDSLVIIGVVIHGMVA